MSPIRRNEVMSMVRQEPMAYRAAYDSSSNVEYEGWAAPGTATSAAEWVIAKHTYDGSNRITATQWAGTPVASFTATWDNRTSETYA